jgi:tetratricopeptide (TPR) repeat protein
VNAIRRTGCFALLLSVICAPWSHCQEDESARVQRLYQQAKEDEKTGAIEGAIQKYHEIINLSPKLAAAYNNLGRLYYKQGHLERAIEPLQRATELDPKVEPPRALLGFVFFQMGDFESAKRELGVAARLSPSDSTAKLFLARSMVELKDFRGSLTLLEQVQQQDPKNTEVLYTLGGVYSSLAEITVNRIQVLDPNSYLLEVLLGKVSEIKQLYPDAAEHYKRALERAPDVPDLYYRYAHALWAAGDSENALRAYNNALSRNPYDYRSQWESARILLSDNPQEALHRVNRALELKPDLASALIILGRALLSLEKPNEAIQALRKASALDPDDSAIHFQLARAYRLTGQEQAAQNENAIYERMDKEAHAAKEQTQPSQQ